jgi:sugar phosphate isomerase/epimerase
MQNRREFIRLSSVIAAGIGFNNSVEVFGQKRTQKPISLQLYSINAEMYRNPVLTLKAVAKMGFNQVEPAAYLGPGKEVDEATFKTRKPYGLSTKEFKKVCHDLGLSIPSSHVSLRRYHWDNAKNDLTDDWKRAIEDANILGQQYLINPWFDADRNDKDDSLRAFEIYNKVGEICQKAGLRFGYHNHDKEFVVKYDDEIFYDVMLKSLDSKVVCQQLDICNMSIGGADPMFWLKKYAKHFELIHIKDKHKTKPTSTLLGDGSVDIKSVLDYAKKHTPIKLWVVEDEAHEGAKALASMKANLERLRNRFGMV